MGRQYDWTTDSMLEREYINEALKDHQLATATSWRLHPSIQRLHYFFDVFNSTLFGDRPLPPAAISLDRTGRTRLGHYVPGRNGLGVCHNINVNLAWLDDLTLLEQLVVLAHEMVHERQDIYGKPSSTGWYHNKEWCQMATSIGIVSRPPRGQLIRLTDPFLSLCRDCGIDDPLPDFERVEGRRLHGQGSSTLKKWSCQCNPPVNVRVAVADLDATCNRCGQRFRQQR